MKLTVNIDEGSFRNPGAGRLGVVLRDSQGKVLTEHFENLGHGTNNRAGHKALLKNIELVQKPGGDELEVRSDGQPVVSQINGAYRIRSGLVLKIQEELAKLRLKFNVVHARRAFQQGSGQIS